MRLLGPGICVWIVIAGLLNSLLLVALPISAGAFESVRLAADEIPWFAEIREGTVVAQCTGIGPTGTTFVDPADDPRNR